MSGKKLAPELKLPVVFEPDEGGWHVHVPSLQGCRTWGRSLTEARRNIREAISLHEEELDDADRYAGTVEFEEDIRLSNDTNALIHLSRTAKARAEAEAARAKAIAVLTAHKLKNAEISLRDAGELLGLSQEGVRKLLKAPVRDEDELALVAFAFEQVVVSTGVTFDTSEVGRELHVKMRPASSSRSARRRQAG
jgi:predicted RNase H-like HicB family nuclease